VDVVGATQERIVNSFVTSRHKKFAKVNCGENTWVMEYCADRTNVVHVVNVRAIVKIMYLLIGVFLSEIMHCSIRNKSVLTSNAKRWVPVAYGTNVSLTKHNTIVINNMENI